MSRFAAPTAQLQASARQDFCPRYSPTNLDHRTMIQNPVGAVSSSMAALLFLEEPLDLAHAGLRTGRGLRASRALTLEASMASSGRAAMGRDEWSDRIGAIAVAEDLAAF